MALVVHEHVVLACIMEQDLCYKHTCTCQQLIASIRCCNSDCCNSTSLSQQAVHKPEPVGSSLWLQPVRFACTAYASAALQLWMVSELLAVATQQQHGEVPASARLLQQLQAEARYTWLVHQQSCSAVCCLQITFDSQCRKLRIEKPLQTRTAPPGQLSNRRTDVLCCAT
jgi:hypothetical protein